MHYYKIEVDEKVWNYLKSRAEPFEDTPNSVLNRLLFGNGSSLKDTTKHSYTGNSDVVFPRGIPKALEQTLEVIHEVKKFGRSRTEATNIVAQRRGTAPQTIIDKYCRQLSKRAYEIDELLKEQDLSGFSLLLKTRFRNYKDVIDSFLDSLSGNSNSKGQEISDEGNGERIEEPPTDLFVCRNKASGQYFIFLEDVSDGKALLVTPGGKIKALEPDLFERSEEKDSNYLISHDFITELQIDKYREFTRSVFSLNHEGAGRKTPVSMIPDNRITEDDLIPHIIRVLEQRGGRALKEVVDEEIHNKLKDVFDQPWYQELVSGSIPRWKHHVAWAKERAKHRGLIKWPHQSGHGVWELTQSGH